jgi:hypothetical protein
LPLEKDQMEVEIMRENHIAADEEAYLDAVIDQLSDGDVKWLNEDCPEEDNRSVPFKPFI